MIKLYTVPSYSLPADEFDSHSDVFTVDEIVEQLASDHCFHFRIHPNTRYIFFGDLDNYPNPIDNFIGLLYTFLKDKYNLEFDKENDLIRNLITDKEDEKSKIYRCVRTSSIHMDRLCIELPSRYAYLKCGKSSARD